MAESVAGRVLSVLDAFGDAPDTLRLTDIARRTGLPVPTALRMVRELVAWGGLERAADGSYRLGTRLRTLGAAAPCPRGLLATALPALRTLTTRTGGHADVTIPADGAALCLVTGERLPLHATAAGKVLLAYGVGSGCGGGHGNGDGGTPGRIVGHGPRTAAGPSPSAVRHTPYTVTAPGALGAQLARVRATGLAEAHQEYRLGELSLAAPVFRNGTAVAAVSVTAGTTARPDRLAPAVRQAAATVGRALGG
ncbi:helix-turn-helix domain-containing protein [Streptomyces argyrophyllae]|uniref:Helix-turn-helix domain-containing protein n=1 Tax=Streptomyces argyrophylli TaxID=2726118 RepID=A0A6M4PJ89_9ACTN|nr:IclR family transcriptional regulator C-terminal domain-containing protein [Streptomyces argyrophyllae]QJS09706.1 helix-turn-helix domain-containing protein [Streptomyces argyrophyllae]